jgi:hypothetical protein
MSLDIVKVTIVVLKGTLGGGEGHTTPGKRRYQSTLIRYEHEEDYMTIPLRLL